MQFRAFAKSSTEDPEFSGRDEVYFYLAESLARTDKKPEAIPYLERLLTEFESSEHMRKCEETPRGTEDSNSDSIAADVKEVRPESLGGDR